MRDRYVFLIKFIKYAFPSFLQTHTHTHTQCQTKQNQAHLERFLHTQAKRAQRSTYSLLLRRPCLFLTILLLLFLPFLHTFLLLSFGSCFHRRLFFFLPSFRNTQTETHTRYSCTTRAFSDNIGGRNYESVLSYGPIDVVYTWVSVCVCVCVCMLVHT